jgi:hypothetical protein
MEKRIVKLKLTTQTALLPITTSARTVAELKAELNIDIDWSKHTIIERSTKATLSFDDSVIPATDCILFIMPLETKSGVWTPLNRKEAVATIKMLKELGTKIPFNYTQTSTDDLNVFLKNNQPKKEKNTIAQKIEEKKAVVEETSTEPNVIRLTAGTYTLIVEGTTQTMVVEKMPEGCVNINILVDDTTLEDLDKEAKALKKKITFCVKK